MTNNVLRLPGIWKRISNRFVPAAPETEPELAYDLWAATYDHQPDNLLLSLDRQLFAGLLTAVSLKGKDVVDVGCGTGRHWARMIQQQPASLSGYDISEEMLSVLKQKFPQQKVYKPEDHLLPHHPDHSCDILVSTLTMAHMDNLKRALREWNRIIKPGGQLLLTDYHPVALQKGGNRTFTHEGKTYAVKNYIYPVTDIIKWFHSLGIEVVSLTEKKIDDSMKDWYEKQGALPVFQRFAGTPILYGMHLKKRDVVT